MLLLFNGWLTGQTYEEGGRGNTNTDSDDGGHFWLKRVYFCAGHKYATPEMTVDSSPAGLRSSCSGSSLLVLEICEKAKEKRKKLYRLRPIGTSAEKPPATSREKKKN